MQYADTEGILITGATASVGASITLLEATNNGANTVKIQAPASAASDITITLPSTTQTLAGSSDLSGTGGAASVGLLDTSAYYTGTDLEAVLDEIEAQIGGDTSATFNFSEANVCADDDAVYAAIEKLDLKFGDLASTANGEGAALVSIEDAGSQYTGTTVEAALSELADGVTPGIFAAVVSFPDATGGGTTSAGTVQINDLAGVAATRAVVGAIIASATQYGNSPHTAPTFGTATTGTILEAGTGYVVFKTDAAGAFACTATNASDETVYLTVVSHPSVDALASGGIIRACVPDSVTWSA